MWHSWKQTVCKKHRHLLQNVDKRHLNGQFIRSTAIKTVTMYKYKVNFHRETDNRCGFFSRHSNVSHSRRTDRARSRQKKSGGYLLGLVSSTSGWTDTAKESGTTEANQGKQEKQTKAAVRSFSGTSMRHSGFITIKIIIMMMNCHMCEWVGDFRLPTSDDI